ncbi:hypothetical protein BCV69DRAFT_310328 [Microstroma glucosiphilum]|uniref:A to I editase domain-containing protein n=1 Tax=Pseudomicrostroma glucosiphilum TaxID=1684307 RepID=A0A316UD59_9BASI|nr:hypothetical protein BCV69DRAFT_310328 [Pseudomicrostroma glucosiphilum]PWN22818.1 hypothetical protein BCV69DRAFT_310328 [Pseudomicrostroma glucosiphilum]
MASSPASASSKPSLGDLVAEATLALYSSLSPSSATHLPIRNGALEWTILSSVSLVLPTDATPRVIPIALGTGTKTTPYENLKGTPGDVLHDLHAEVLARRGARRWLAQRIAVEAGWTKQREEGQDETGVLLDGLPLLLQKRSDNQIWQLREGIKVWWYVSTLPCGECSSPHLARRRAKEDVSYSRDLKAHCQTRSTFPSSGDMPRSQSGAVLRGRQVVDEGLARPRLRTVPGRPDAPPSLCHSCTDKLLLWSLLGWQGAALSRLATDRMPIDGLVVGASDVDLRQDSAQERVLKEIRRGLDVTERCNDAGRELTRRLKDAGVSHSLEPPLIELTRCKFLQSQDCVRERAIANGMRLEEATGSAEAATTKTDAASVEQTGPIALIPAWESSSYVRPTWLDVKSGAKHASGSAEHTITAPVAKLEKLVYGIKQGASTKRSSNRLLAGGRYAPLYGKSRSKVCKLEHFLLMRNLAQELEVAVQPDSYAELKGKGRPNDSGVADQYDSNIEWYRSCKAILRAEHLVDENSWSEDDAGERAVVNTWLQQVSLTGDHAKASDGIEKSTTEGLETALDASSGGRQDGLLSSDRAPLQGWLITPRSMEAFDREGAWR